MFPIGPELATLGVFVLAVFALFVGVLTGFVVSFILKLPRKGLVTDALLGFMGFATTFIAFILVPWPRNIDPRIPAFFVAVALPALHQFFRFRRISEAK
ncbi:MAG TPA: hypothetical protein VE422_38275 [Terriglobia bacterium]|nr:hypothetical protein [Terriglobia bacterium]